jgi:hypothetical protein
MNAELMSNHAVLQETLNQKLAAHYGNGASTPMGTRSDREVNEMRSDLFTVDSGSNVNGSVLDVTLASTYPQEVVPHDDKNHTTQLFE